LPSWGTLGAARISLGSLLPRTALASVERAAREIEEHGTFGCAGDALPYAAANQLTGVS
jgi:hypothetical protein